MKRETLDLRQISNGEDVSPAESPRIRTVLICEDEPLIRMVTADMLEGLGIRAVETGTAGEALAVMDASIDLLISDVSLPDGSGIELARKVRETHPAIPVVFATGHNMKAPFENSTVLGKPFDESDLARALGLTPP